MDLDNIADEEILYRAIRRGLGLYENGILDPSIFINPKGVSVSRDGGRSEQEIIGFLSRKIVDKKTGESLCEGYVKISAGKCREAQTYPKACGNEIDHYHAEIHHSETEKVIPLIKAITLCTLCEIIL